MLLSRIIYSLLNLSPLFHARGCQGELLHQQKMEKMMKEQFLPEKWQGGKLRSVTFVILYRINDTHWGLKFYCGAYCSNLL